MFLSTLPSRVATFVAVGRSGLHDVSIHATLAGGDGEEIVKLVSFLVFLSTPPSRVAT